MAVPGPSDRVYTIDDHAASPLNWTPLIVGDVGNAGALEAALHELTGSGHSSPVILPAGFTRVSDMTVTFQADVGGSSPGDPTTSFYVTRTGSRTFAITFVTNWTFSSESYIFSSVPKTSPELLSLLEVGFRFTGAATVT
ncbi:MAG: hypothetical protein IPK80_02915 [Nannocystis sp.]|nr:hypothetical protein [Nannocystis sp.]